MRHGSLQRLGDEEEGPGEGKDGPEHHPPEAEKAKNPLQLRGTRAAGGSRVARMSRPV